MPVRYLSAILALALSLVSAASSLASAQNGNAAARAHPEDHAAQQAKEAAELSLEELANVEVYSASKHMQRTSEAPSSVTVITRDEIQKYGYRTLADILRSVRGFYSSYDRADSFVGVRGIERPGDYNSHVLLLVDGHRLNDDVYDMALLGQEFPIDLDLVERVEIIRGPSSSLYGTGAFLAVINVITRKAQQLSGLELSFEPSSFGSYKGVGSYGGRYKGVDMVLSTSFYTSQGQDLFYREFDSPATNHGIAHNVDGDQHQHGFASLSFRGLTLQGAFSAYDKRIPTAYYGTVFNDPRTKETYNHDYADASYQHSVGEQWDLSARVYYGRSWFDFPTAFGPGPPEGVSARGTWWGNELKLSRTLLKRHALSFGSEVRDNLKQNQITYTSAGDYSVDQRNSWIWAFYAQDEFAITHRLTLSAGLRYDHYYSFGGTTNPRLGLIYHGFQQTTFKLLYGTAFRAPDVFDIYPAGLYESNPGLKPERIRSIETVVEQGLGSHFKLSGSFFVNRLNDLIVAEIDPNNGLIVHHNAESANADGAEVELEGRSSVGLQGRASYSYTNAVDGTTRQLLSRSPQHLGKLNFIVPLWQQRLFASVDAQYTSPRETLAGNTVSGFSVFNVTLLGHALGKHVDVSASVYNILDKKYFDPGRPEDTQDEIQQDGRNFRIKTTVRF
jgi:iron complex outermembrane receptor protein